MKVLYVVHQYPPEFIGGVEVYTEELAQAILQRGWQVGVFHRSYSQEKFQKVRQLGGLPIFSISVGAFSPSQRFLSTWRQPAIDDFWKKTLDQFKPDLVHIQHLMGLPESILERLTQLDIPYIITLWDYWWVCANANLLTNYSQTACHGPRFFLNCTRCVVARSGQPATWIASPLLLGLLLDRNRRLNNLLRGAMRLLSPSIFVRDWYKRHGVPQNHIHIVRPGVTPLTQPRSYRKPRGEEIRFLYVGGLAPNKGVHILLEALRKVKGKFQLSIVGDISAHPHYANLLHRMADERVTFLGKADRLDVWRAFADADAVAVPSLWHETFCLVAHEALAVGTPVLASEMGALTEAIRDGVNGLLLPPGDIEAWRIALQQLVDNPQILDRMRSQMTAPLYFEQHVDHIENIYREILEG